jgi:hypothetical protein
MFGRKAAGIALPLILAAALGGHELPREVVRRPDAGEALAARFSGALREAAGRKYGTGFWIGYSVKRLMGERSCIGSFDGDGRTSNLTVEEILAGKRIDHPLGGSGEGVQTTARRVLDELENKKNTEKQIWKEIALLFRYGNSGGPGPERVEMTNLDLAFDFKGLPFIWVGSASDDESLACIGKLYDSAGTDGKLKEHLVAAAGIHGSPGLVVPFLDGILKGRDPDHVRKDAAFWIGQQNDPAGLKILIRTARTDASVEVRKSAVFAISEVELEESVDELINLARTCEDWDVRHEAVFWLGQRASKKAGAALVEFATKDVDTRIQEQAVFALSELPDNQGLEPLIKIARTHPNPHVRKKAVFWLGESKDPRALDALVAIVKGR